MRDAFKKIIAQKFTLEATGGRRVKKSPFFASLKRGHIFMEGGVKIFLSHVPYSLLFYSISPSPTAPPTQPHHHVIFPYC